MIQPSHMFTQGKLYQLEIVDQWSTGIPLPSRRGSSWQCVDCDWISSKNHYSQVMCYWSFDLMFKAKLKLEYRNWKIHYGSQAAILKVTLLKINRLLPIYTSNLLLKFGLGYSKLESGNWKNPIWPPGGYFESDIAENQQASFYTHKSFVTEVWIWYSKPN